MMTGSVQSRHVTLPITFLRPEEPDLIPEFVIDTGFTDYLTLPPAAVRAMGLPFQYHTAADLADDSTVEMAVHAAIILWNDVPMEVRVIATGRRPLLGTALLDDSDLFARFREGGLVRIESVE